MITEESLKRRADLVLLVLAGFVFLPPERPIQRFAEFVSTDGLTHEGRTDLWAETIPLIRAYQGFGCGLGGYETAFSRFKISGVLVTDDFVHNDYLQGHEEVVASKLSLPTGIAETQEVEIRDSQILPDN